jgi:hypothetical protein
MHPARVVFVHREYLHEMTEDSFQREGGTRYWSSLEDYIEAMGGGKLGVWVLRFEHLLNAPVVGWTLVQNQYELTKFEDENYISYRGRPASFPCLVRDNITSDENSETYILTVQNVTEMLALLNTANATDQARERSGGSLQ